MFALAACGSVYCTACSLFLCLLLVSDDSPLTEPWASIGCQRGCWQICILLVPSVCTHSLCVWREGSPWHLAALPYPLLLKDDNDKSVGVEWSGWGVKIPFWFPANGARAVQFGHPESPPKWRQAGGARYHKALPHSGLFIPDVRDIPEVIFGELTEMETGSNRGMILYSTP